MKLGDDICRSGYLSNQIRPYYASKLIAKNRNKKLPIEQRSSNVDEMPLQMPPRCYIHARALFCGRKRFAQGPTFRCQACVMRLGSVSCVEDKFPVHHLPVASASLIFLHVLIQFAWEKCCASLPFAVINLIAFRIRVHLMQEP